eukprot:TRINITY_DN1984_c0_g1_i1.p1 TRINITY_DN1984_c0_g1~~TRINITY_DN1984_c0_g1_i1.p1  ORF type:complete len:303 (+),score=49.95 TRINITY_DN1984_c0_g1_i1:47-955(+)
MVQQRVPKLGPTNLDLECKDALQNILRPSNFGVIDPWLKNASSGAKRDMVQLASLAKGTDKDKRPVYGVVQNPMGRCRSGNIIPMTADRMQADLLKLSCGSDSRCPIKEEKRQYLARYSSVPSTTSVSDFTRLQTMPVRGEEFVKVLTEQARGQLERWQVKGPEHNPNASAEMMRSLRSISTAVDSLQTYPQHIAHRKPGTKACSESLYAYSVAVPKGHRTLGPSALPRLSHSSSAPANFKPFLESQELENIDKPGGYVVGLQDKVPIQKIKNLKRGSQSKINQFGGAIEYGTTYSAMCSNS